jgi:FtsH-binding integral membrane protein
MNQSERNGYQKTSYGDYRTIERDNALPMEQEAGARVFVNRVYNWMFCGLMITTLVAWGITQLGEAAFKKAMALALPLMIVELLLVIVLSAAIRKMSAPVAGALFIAYSAMNGLTLSPIFLVYTQTSIFLAFGSCALMFAATSTFGYMTGMKLDTVGSYCFMGLIGIIIASLVNFFLHSEMLDYILSYAGVAIFVGLTAWDTQKVRMVGEANGEEAQSDAMRKVAIVFALSLYLDFINLFLYLLRIFGRRR